MASIDSTLDAASQIRLSTTSQQPTTTTSSVPTSQPSSINFGPPAKLEPFLLLAKSAKGAGAAKLVGECLAREGVYVFGELVRMERVRELKSSPEHAPIYDLLEIFAYGTWNDYVVQADRLPKLTETMETKLKQLTIVTMVWRSRLIPYSLLHARLSVTPSSPQVPTEPPKPTKSQIKELEALIVSAIYAGVIQGRLDQKQSQLEVDWCMGRDVKLTGGDTKGKKAEGDAMDTDSIAPGAEEEEIANTLPHLTQSMTLFSSRISSLLHSLDNHITTLTKSEDRERAIEARHRKEVEKSFQECQVKVEQENAQIEKAVAYGAGGGRGKTRAAGGGGGAGWGMDVDEWSRGGGGAGGSMGGLRSPGGSGGAPPGGRQRKRTRP